MAVVELLSPQDLVPQVHSALRAWYSQAGTNEDLLSGLLLIQEERRAMSHSTSPTALRLATNQILLAGIEELASADEIGANILNMRFADGNTLLMVANKINVSEHTVSRMQRAAIVRLASILYERELEARRDRASLLESKLPPPTYSKLYGVEAGQQQLIERITEDGGPGVLAIVGIGGIGKTALADTVTRRLVRKLQFDELTWVRSAPQTMSGHYLSPEINVDNLIAEIADDLELGDLFGSREERLSRIRQVLKDRPHLIIIDNLESHSEIAFLLEELNDLAEPSRFILTTRTRQISQAAVFYFELNELSFGDASSLVIHHAKDIGLHEPSEIDEASMRAIYSVTGGNPLALKMVVGLLDLVPLHQVLKDIKTSGQGMVEDLYKHIYWQAWQILSPDAKSLLQAMPLIGETGGLPEYLQTISKLPAERFWPALLELRSRSLVETRGTIKEKRYGIHQLTESFLRTEIIHWPEK